MEAINDFFATVSSFLWGWPMIIMLLGTHLYLTIRLHFPQRKIFTAIRLSVSRDKGASGDVSQFGALAGACRYDRHGQHHRSGNGRCFGRPGCRVVVLADGCLRYLHEICGRIGSRQVPRQDERRAHARRPDVRLGARCPLQMARGMLRALRHHRFVRHRQHRAGQCHLYDGRSGLRRASVGYRSCSCYLRCCRDPWRCEVHR